MPLGVVFLISALDSTDEKPSALLVVTTLCERRTKTVALPLGCLDEKTKISACAETGKE